MIRDLRKARGITQKELARRAGITETFVSMVEREPHNMTVRSLTRLVKGLGLKMSEFYEEVESC